VQGPIIDFILITGQGSGGSRCDALVSNDGASICHDISRYDGIHCAAGGHHLTTRVSRLLRRRGPHRGSKRLRPTSCTWHACIKGSKADIKALRCSAVAPPGREEMAGVMEVCCTRRQRGARMRGGGQHSCSCTPQQRFQRQLTSTHRQRRR